MVRIGTFGGIYDTAATLPANSDATVMTGAGSDTVFVHGNINADMNTAASATSANVDGSEDGDTVVAGALNAHLSTGSGNDVVSLTYVSDTGSINTADQNDEVTVTGDVDGNIDLGTGVDTLSIGGDLDAAVTAGSDAETGNDNGKDTIVIGGDLSPTASITTQAGDDTIFIGGEVEVSEVVKVAPGVGSPAPEFAIDMGVGSDTLQVEGELNRAVIMGVASEANGYTEGESNTDEDTVLVGRYTDGGDFVASDVGGYGDIATDAGNDTVTVGHLGVADADFMGDIGFDEGLITTETDDFTSINVKGNGKTENDSHIDETHAVDIVTGTGEDVVTAKSLDSAGQYNDNFIGNAGTGDADLNRDDTVTIVGASIVTGAGVDEVHLAQDRGVKYDSTVAPLMAEQTLVDTGSEKDTVTASVSYGVVMERDNAKTGVLTEIEGTDRANLDSLGAKIDLGAGDDELIFNDTFDTVMEGENLLVTDKGAVIDGGNDNDVLTVNTIDEVNVVASKTYHNVATDLDQNGTLLSELAGLNDDNKLDTTAGQGGHINGIETIKLTIEDSIKTSEAAVENVDSNNDGIVEVKYVANDDVVGGFVGSTPTMRLDVEQVDNALNTIDLTSNEVRHEVDNIDGIDGYWREPAEGGRRASYLGRCYCTN